MPAKQVTVSVHQGASFHTECTAGKHTIVVDQPTAAGGTDAGPTPLDYQLAALGGCITAIGRIIANQRKLPVSAISATLEGVLNTDRLLGKRSDDRVGFSSIKVDVRIDGPLSVEEKRKLLSEIEERCPISENLKEPTKVTVTLA